MKLAVSGAHKWAKWLYHPYQPGVHNGSRRDEITGGYLTLAILWAYMWAKSQHNRCHFRAPQHLAQG